MRQSAREDPQEAVPPSRLAELLACESELAELMSAARKEARRRVEEARREAERAEAELKESLERESERVRREVGEGAKARIRDILEGARQRAARFESISDHEVERLAAAALRRLLGMEERSA